MKYAIVKINHGINKYKRVFKLEVVEYLNEASDKTIIKKVITKISFWFLLKNILFFGTTIKKQHMIVIMGIYKGL